MGIRRSEARVFPCKCCGFWTLTDPAYGSYEICPVCFWEDDPVQNENPLYAGGANDLSLAMARQNYIECGACEVRFVSEVRSPMPHEIPPSLSSPDPDLQPALARGVNAAILNASRSILAQKLDPIEGCSLIAWLARGFEPSGRPIDPLLIFEVVASELDDVPAGDTRNVWEPEALAQKDAEAAAYIARVLPQVHEACKSLERCLTPTSSCPK